MESKCILG
jgi:calcium-dependent protein kinase